MLDTQFVPISPKEKGAGLWRQSPGSLAESICFGTIDFGIPIDEILISGGMFARDTWTKYSIAASDLLSEVYMTAVSFVFHRPPVSLAPLPDRSRACFAREIR